MECIRTALMTVLVSVVLVTPTLAQPPHIADQVVLDAQVSAKSAEAADQRTVIQRLLEREPVRAIADRWGIDVAEVETAVATLDGEELAQLAAQAQQVDDSLAGGQSTITLSTTTIIIGLLILILIIVAV
jgi:hypothetical protein